MTARVRRGLATLAELGRSWIEADSDPDENGENHSQSLSREDEADAEAALVWVARGGLHRPGDEPNDPEVR